MAKWASKINDLGANAAVKSNAVNLQRDFVVLIRQTKYDIAKGKYLSEY